MAGPRKPKTELDDRGRQVFRYDKGPDESDPQPRYATAREGTVKFDLLDNTAGWYRVDAKERVDAEAAKAAREDKLIERKAENARMNPRQRSTMGDEPARRSRPTNAEKAAKERAAAAEAKLAEQATELDKLKARLAELESTGATS